METDAAPADRSGSSTSFAAASSSDSEGANGEQQEQRRVELEAAIFEDPGCIDNYVELAQCLDPLPAKRLLERAATQMPHSAKLRLALATVLADRLDENESAIRELTTAMDLDPHCPQITFRLAQLLQHHARRYRLAEGFYKLTLKLQPDNAEACFNLALLLENDEYDHEAGRGHSSSDSDSDSEGETTGAASSAPVKDRFDRVRDLYRRTLEIDPGHSEARGNLVSLLEDHYRDPAGARRVWEDALSRDPSDQEALFNLASIARSQQEPQKARDLFERLMANQRRQLRSASSLVPIGGSPVATAATANAAREVAELLVDATAENKRARRLYEAALAIDPNLVSAHLHLAMLCHESLGDDVAAERHLNAVLDEVPDNVDALFALANIAAEERRSDFAEARRLYERVLEVDRRHVGALNNLALLLERRFGDPEGALELYERALGVVPGVDAACTADICSNLASLLVETRGDFARARDLFERALSADPMHAHALKGIRALNAAAV